MYIADPYPSDRGGSTDWDVAGEQRVYITADHEVLIDGVRVPGVIAEDGVTVHRGSTDTCTLNTLTLTLLVSDLEIDDAVINDVTVIEPLTLDINDTSTEES
ncbi:hypothetical protein [Mycobacteroides abscessus]|uniref:hypothetical protein n=1 Tax=Mycobacteroides abscessus TaxID=36809 RepID=UPI0009258D83|nr:hypothetical protein [Mycobacteroides abscessus]DAZ90335.1 TPA_asm: hypothetical protein PROPHIFSQJ01-1_49 [Mycobacterium phage prophiFSQJ01-1]SII41111.1 Uncharacterised protein [Mycobacteroides abscessus subsp. abscessus]SIK14079.1 Uncharacterised protein [Mycobacteroides abscessus subsp. abscessus]SIN25465.1 Uncharacterised protein [Mycobacteroides abscessus subsp. abscessus]SLI51481.1 Uncharacterised protein [Mycobacteroides abscessus subsp. abscessus]